MKFSLCSWLRLFRDMSPHDRIGVWAREIVALQRRVTELEREIQELRDLSGLGPQSPTRHEREGAC